MLAVFAGLHFSLSAIDVERPKTDSTPPPLSSGLFLRKIIDIILRFDKLWLREDLSCAELCLSEV
jgi:hypothetical protein